jgi:hypothetical protein
MSSGFASGGGGLAAPAVDLDRCPDAPTVELASVGVGQTAVGRTVPGIDGGRRRRALASARSGRRVSPRRPGQTGQVGVAVSRDQLPVQVDGFLPGGQAL